MDRVKRIFGFLSKLREGVIRIRTEEPDYSDIPIKEYDWFRTIYQGAEELTRTPPNHEGNLC